MTPHLGMVFHPDDSMLMAIPTRAVQTRPLLIGPAMCCCFGAISGVGGPRPRLDQPLPHCLPSPFRALRAGVKGRAARVAPQGADKRTADDPGAEVFRMWDFGEPGHSALGNLCLLRQVSRASTEGDVATVGDLAMFGVEVKQSQTRRSTLMHSGLDTSRVRGHVGFICLDPSSRCFSAHLVAKCHSSADTWYQKSPWPGLCPL